jgi:hypothetical protein
MYPVTAVVPAHMHNKVILYKMDFRGSYSLTISLSAEWQSSYTGFLSLQKEKMYKIPCRGSVHGEQGGWSGCYGNGIFKEQVYGIIKVLRSCVVWWSCIFRLWWCIHYFPLFCYILLGMQSLFLTSLGVWCLYVSCT